MFNVTSLSVDASRSSQPVFSFFSVEAWIVHMFLQHLMAAAQSPAALAAGSTFASPSAALSMPPATGQQPPPQQQQSAATVASNATNPGAPINSTGDPSMDSARVAAFMLWQMQQQMQLNQQQAQQQANGPQSVLSGQQQQFAQLALQTMPPATNLRGPAGAAASVPQNSITSYTIPQV